MGKALNQSISTFYGLHHEKGKSYTFEHFKKVAHKSRIYRIMKHFDERGHCNRQAGSGRPEKMSARENFAKQMNLDWEASINS